MFGKRNGIHTDEVCVGFSIRRFEIKPVNVDKPVFVPLLTAHMAGGFNVRIYHRASNEM